MAHKQTSQELIDAKVEADKANLAKSAFLANMTHELKTPMHAILGFSNIGISKINELSKDKALSFFERINASGHKLLDLLDNLLDLSKLEVGQMDYFMRENDIRNVIKEVTSEFIPSFKKKNIAFKVKNGGVYEKFVFDYNKIAQVLRNLLSNAVKYSPNGREISIELQPSELMLNNRKTKAIRITVTDQGVGVPKTEVENIFERFIESSRTRSQAGGRGIGLAICFKIIDSHQGRIWVEPPKSGKGSNFIFVLPTNLESKCFEIGF
jgi:signal transduction histidine kinase